MSKFTDLANELRGIAPEIAAVLEVADAATSMLGYTTAANVLKVVEAAFTAFVKHQAGALSHDDFVAQIAQYQQDLAGARAAEDAEIDALAPPAGTP